MLGPVVGMETASGAPVDPAHDMSISSQEAELCGSSRIAAVTGPALAQGMGTEWGCLCAGGPRKPPEGRTWARPLGRKWPEDQGSFRRRDIGTGELPWGPLDITRGAWATVGHCSQEGFQAGCLLPAEFPFEFCNEPEGNVGGAFPAPA